MADISKITLPNGTTYNIKDSTALHTPITIMSTNPFAGSGHGGSDLYIPKIDNALYCADKRFNITVTGNYISFDGGVPILFNGNYDNNALRIADDETVTITFDFSNLPSQKFPGYPYGFIYVTFYASCKPKTIVGRVYNNYESQTVGWKELTFENCFGSVYRTENKFYGLQTLEISVTGDGSVPYGYSSISEIDMHLTRPNPAETPFLNKYTPETLYYDLTAPGFKGSGASLTNLNGSNVTSGTIASERLPVMEGATEENNGTSGIVPAPTTEDKNYFLKGDGTWSPLVVPIATKTYTNVIATSNDNVGGAFFYLKVRANNWTDKWHIKTKVFATVPGNALYETETYFDIWGYENTYGGYICKNYVRSTSYRPIYYNNYFRIAKTGYDNGCGGWLGFSLYNSTNPLDTSLKRTVTVDLFEYENCTVDFQDSLITPTNIPERAAHTDYYSSTNTSFDNFDAAGQGIKSSGDNNTTSISNLYYYNGNFIADSVIYRYQLLFHVNDDKLSPLNNNSNTTGTTKTLLTDLEFYPFKDIFYYNSTTTVNANAAIGATTCFYSISGFDLRYTFNITSSTLTAHKNVYLKLTPTSGFLAKLASASPITQNLPASEDGYLYLLLGRAYSGYQISLYPKHPIYYYYNDRIVELILDNAKSTVYYNDTKDTLELTSGLKVNGILEPQIDDKSISFNNNANKEIYLKYEKIDENTFDEGALTVGTKASAGNIIFVNGVASNNSYTSLTPALRISNNKICIGMPVSPLSSEPIGKFNVTGDSYFNGSIYATSYSNLPVASTSTAGIVQLDDNIDSNSTTTAPTVNSVKKLYDLLDGLEIKKRYRGSTINAINTVDENINNFIIYGKSIQDGVPSTSNPIDITSVGINNTIIINNNGSLITLNLTDELRGIPVESDGNYTDTTGQQWICDTIDLFNKKYIKRVDEKNVQSTNAKYVESNNYIAKDIASNQIVKSKYTGQLCNRFVFVSSLNTVSSTPGTFKVHNPANGVGTHIYFHAPEGVTDNATAQSWMDENPITVLYPLAEPIEYNLTEAQITALQNLRSYNNITNIFTTDECQPEIETSLYTSLNIE